MKRPLRASLVFIITFLFLAISFANAALEERGSIRGTFYQDQDGNGICGSGDTTIAGLGIDFISADGSITISLVSGANGTYGLVGSGLGTWTVMAVPLSGWQVTSANPLTITIDKDDPIATNVDFCVQGGGSAVTAQAETVTGLDTVGDASITAVSGQPPSLNLESNFEVSESLLTQEIEGPSYADLEESVPNGNQDVQLGDQPEWLAYVNQFRLNANLPPVTESPALTQGASNHARFMVMNDLCCAHSENPSNPLFTENGNSSGINGNIFSSTWTGSKMEHAVNFWMSAPFHILGILDPRLTEVGYGEFRQESGVFHYASVLDVRSNDVDNMEISDDIFPIYFPADGSETFVVRRSLPEWPNPLTSPGCTSYSTPTGPSIVLMIGSGDETPIVTSQKVFENGGQVESCVFTETTYENPDPYAQDTGRVILGIRDAVMVTPRNPLIGGATYRVELMVNGEEYSWEFTAREK